MKRWMVLLVWSVALWGQQPAQAPPKELTVEAIFAEGGLTGRAPETFKWSPDSSRLSYVQRDDSGERGELGYVDATTGKAAVLVSREKLAGLAPPARQLKDDRERERRSRYSVASYHWAPDSQHLLFDSNGQLWYFSLQTGTAVQVTSSPEPSGDPKFSPDGRRLAYVRKHNLYVRRLDKDRERPLTRDQDEAVLNGEVDWVYAEELDVRSNYFWSPGGNSIAFLQMNETPVPGYPITDFLPTHPTVDFQKYPKAGDPNPAVRVGVVDTSTGKSLKWITLPPQQREPDEAGTRPREAKDLYIPRFGWVREGLLWAQVLNRAQDRLDLYFVDLASGRSQLMLTEKNDAWVEVHDNFRILRSGDRFLWSSWRDGHTHLYLYRFQEGNPPAPGATLEKQLTHGDFETFGIQAVDEDAGVVYFIANQGDARERHLYSVKLDGSDFRRISRQPGTHADNFSPDARHYVDNYSALMTPPQISFCATGGACQKLWEARSLADYNLIQPRLVDFRAEDGTVLHGLVLAPPGFSAAPAHSVPVLLNPYGGPIGQTVRNAWGGTTFLFHQILARQGIAILQVDNRGMGARGLKFTAALRRNFGEVELKDQLAALDQALAANPALDSKRIGFWGWSYGGYMTLYALTHSERFAAGVAVAPVTDWQDYDSIYTERYMGLPKENADGYRRSSPVNSAANLHGRLLIVHGTSDDNVHMQNTMQMVQALIAAAKPFDLALYPRKTHGIAGAVARTHLFRRIQRQFEQNLQNSPSAESH
ncbi:MAG: S9 family peptidase [Terriglobales bacterium]